MQIERRFNAGPQAGVRLEPRSGGGDGKRIVGYGAVFYDGTPGTEYKLWEGAVERIARGAFDPAIRRDDVRGLFNHNPDHLLGLKSADTLRLVADQHGLRFAIDLPDSPIGQTVREAIRRRDLKGCSFSFAVSEGGETWTQEGALSIRTLTALQLFDVGPVTFPAYTGTSATLADSDATPTRDAQLFAQQQAVRARMCRVVDIDTDLLRL